MKQKLIAFLAVVTASAGLVTGVAGAAPGTTAVTGVITDNFVAVAGASVTVWCNGNTETDTTDAMGSYLVTYPTASCVFGSTAKVTAVKGGHSGVSSGTITGVTTKLNLGIINVSIPEFGLIGAALAGSLGIGLIAYSRRRKLSEQQF